jgi:ELP3 family radical SAM enzyme/protein acetyltransferase
MHLKMSIQDIESFIEVSNEIPDEKKLKLFFKDLLKFDLSTTHLIERAIVKLRSKYKIEISKAKLRYIYEKYFYEIPINKILSRFMIKKACRSRSGVLVCTIVLKPDVFSCPKKCSYCPTETDLNGNPTQPKSYLSSEPAMLRAIQYNFDIKGQIWDRLQTYVKTGNIILDKNKMSEDVNKSSYKLEIIISGGTWESYPLKYREQVMSEIYYAANNFSPEKINSMNSKEKFLFEENNKNEKLNVSEQIIINQFAKFRIIGLTIETRPDFITKTSIKDYRRWGVTRVQIGVQHYDDKILEKINRECYTKDTIKAIKMLKQCGFKIVCHLMPDLPGSSPDLDRWMFNQAIKNQALQFDDVKIYPTAICQSHNENFIVKSDISDWYQQGLYKPYSELNLRDLINVLKEYKTNIQPWIRIQRLVRDIPKQSIEAGYDRISNLRQVIHDEMKKENIRCRCIRCMEIGEDDDKMKDSKLVVRQFKASDDQEFYISYESYKEWKWYSKQFWMYVWFIFTYYFMFYVFNKITFFSGDMDTYDGLIGFCRLRLDSNPGGGFIKELKDCALIREVHVYGHSLGVGANDTTNSSQHKGYGKNLVKTAEIIAKQHGFKKVAVIAGVGTREYYAKKCGYDLEGTYMVKKL